MIKSTAVMATPTNANAVSRGSTALEQLFAWFGVDGILYTPSTCRLMVWNWRPQNLEGVYLGGRNTIEHTLILLLWQWGAYSGSETSFIVDLPASFRVCIHGNTIKSW